MLELTGLDRRELLHTSSPDLTPDPDATRVSLGLLANGTLQGYSRQVLMPHARGSVRVDVRVDACGREPQSRWAVVTVVPTESEGASRLDGPPLVGPLGYFRLLGTLDRNGVIDRVVTAPPIFAAGHGDALIGVTLADLVHPLDAGMVLLLLAQCDTQQLSVTAQARLRLLSGEWQVFQLTLQRLHGPHDQHSSGYAFTICPALEDSGASDDDTAAQHERNAHEYSAVHAVSWLSSRSREELNTLTNREIEIVARLLGGQRVSGIARDLFLSQSTVRNHLSAVYRKFGVRSQTELLDTFRRGV